MKDTTWNTVLLVLRFIAIAFGWCVAILMVRFMMHGIQYFDSATEYFNKQR